MTTASGDGTGDGTGSIALFELPEELAIDTAVITVEYSQAISVRSPFHGGSPKSSK